LLKYFTGTVIIISDIPKITTISEKEIIFVFYKYLPEVIIIYKRIKVSLACLFCYYLVYIWILIHFLIC